MSATVGEMDALNLHRVVALDLVMASVEATNVPQSSGSPDDDVLDKELRAYLVAAVAHLPERLRRVVIGYFVDDLPMQVLADELGVTESRISQMRSEAVVLLRNAINTQLDPDLVPEETSKLTTKRHLSYYAAVGAHDNYRHRLEPAAGRLASLAGTPALAFGA